MAGPKIDMALVQHVAKLASLSLSEAEVARYVAELGRIVAHVEHLGALDTSEVPPTAHVQLDRLPYRPDEIVPCLSREEALAQAPKRDENGFVVPAFVE
jgi:aspartyl-tRNA(Asn)/glutamyl-tRNA(Gln) amidotransferase subunit C